MFSMEFYLLLPKNNLHLIPSANLDDILFWQKSDP